MPRWLLLVLLPALASAAEVPILCLDPGGHTAAVRSVVAAVELLERLVPSWRDRFP